MEIRGLTRDDFARVVTTVSEREYDGNLRLASRSPALLNQAGTRFRERVTVASSRGPGARRSASGRRLAVACWHVFRDVVRATLAEHQAAEFRTRLATYTVETFESVYPATGYTNQGSAFQPVQLMKMCECDGNDPSDWCRPFVARPQPCALPMPDDDTEPDSAVLERIDASLAIEAGKCGWCGRDTGGTAMLWCSSEHQESWQARYALTPVS